MQNDPLAQLRDVHLPTEPSWWPPAPGWWLLLALIALLAGLAWRAHLRHRKRREPFRIARTLHANLLADARSGQIAITEYLNRSNALLKRCVLFGIGDTQAAQLTGEPWLDYLDRLVAEPAYSRGVGRLLGDGRFARPASVEPGEDLSALGALIERTLTSMPVDRITAQAPAS